MFLLSMVVFLQNNAMRSEFCLTRFPHRALVFILRAEIVHLAVSS